MIPQIQAPPSVLPQIVGNPSGQGSVGDGAVAVHRLRPAEHEEQGLLNEKVREAFAWRPTVTRTSPPYGGPQVRSPSVRDVQPARRAASSSSTRSAPPPQATRSKAKQMLQDAGVTTPVKITVVVPLPPDGRQGALGAEGVLGPGGFRCASSRA